MADDFAIYVSVEIVIREGERKLGLLGHPKGGSRLALRLF
jgi:hypothetical protein